MTEKPEQVRVCLWLDQPVADVFRATYPEHGALTKFMRDAVNQHVAQLKETSRNEPK